MQVVNLRSCSAMLRLWSEVRNEIIRGELQHLAVSKRTYVGEDTVIFAGECGSNRQEAARAAMRLSWELTKEQDAKEAHVTGT